MDLQAKKSVLGKIQSDWKTLHAESTHSDKLEVARQLLKLREGEISQGKLPGIVYDRVKFDELIEDLLLDYRVNQKRTVAKAERCARYLLDEFGGMKAVEVTTTRIKQLIEKRKKQGSPNASSNQGNRANQVIEKRKEQGFSNASINRELAALKRAFNLAARCTPPKVAQVPYIPMLRENNVRKGFFEYEDFLALRDALPYYLKPVLVFGYHPGGDVGKSWV